MTTVYATDAGGVMRLSVRGHATGSDQVCAAVSGLVCALAGYLANDDGAQVQEQVVDSARAVFRFTGGPEAHGAFKAVVIGLQQLAASYPDFIEAGVI